MPSSTVRTQYKLRFPGSLRGSYDIIEEQTGLKPAWFVELTYPFVQLLGPRARKKNDGGLPGYNEEGFLYLQHAIDTTFTKVAYAASGENSSILDAYQIKMQRFPFPPYAFDLYLFSMQGLLPLLMLMSFIYPVINITKSIVYEKEKRLKVTRFEAPWKNRFVMFRNFTGVYENDGARQLVTLGRLVHQVLHFSGNFVPHNRLSSEGKNSDDKVPIR